jgi:hypothetical protein
MPFSSFRRRSPDDLPFDRKDGPRVAGLDFDRHAFRGFDADA